MNGLLRLEEVSKEMLDITKEMMELQNKREYLMHEYKELFENIAHNAPCYAEEHFEIVEQGHRLLCLYEEMAGYCRAEACELAASICTHPSPLIPPPVFL